MTVYTLNFYYLSYQSQHNLKHKKRINASFHPFDPDLSPHVTIQLPFYNERYVASRVIDAVCKMDYPKQKMQIQILDDSDDETAILIKNAVQKYRANKFDIEYIHGNHERSGYKAGALKEGMKHVKGDFVAIFDADFIPPQWFLTKTIGHFLDPAVGLVQCRWGHINENYSSLTEAQAVSLDLHFLVEQKAKSMTHLFMNFNGTAGIWRTSCIRDAGGWHTSTLVEDLDLSFRAQMRGWKCLLLEDIIVDAELPVQMNAAKRQQFRWAKGSTQATLKLFNALAFEKRISIETKIQAFIQLTRHIVHPLLLAQFLIFPMLLAMNFKLYPISWAPVSGILMYVLLGPATHLYIIRKIWRNRWKEKAKQYFFLILFVTGISVNNTVAVFDALLDKRNEFLRTPKFGVTRRSDDWENKAYVLPFTKTTVLEIFFAIYGCIAISVSIFSKNSIFVPILLIQTVGFIYVAFFSILHSRSRQKLTNMHQSLHPKLRGDRIRNSSSMFKVKFGHKRNLVDGSNGITYNKSSTRALYDNSKWKIDERKKNLNHNSVIFFVIVAFLAVGAGLAYYGYQLMIYPFEKAMGYLSRAEASQTPELMSQYLLTAISLVPHSGNPVWVFPNAGTDFSLIRSELTAMVSRSNSLKSVEVNTAAYNTGLQDLHGSIRIIKENLEEAAPYLYASLSNILFAVAWIVALLSLFMLIKKINNARYKEYETH
jgi:cellulose synthase/poly-beta-1,6-N-acetylglucosamine synthase-like glycosyltransferase